MFIWEMSLILHTKFFYVALIIKSQKSTVSIESEQKVNLKKTIWFCSLKVLMCQCDGMSEADGKIRDNPAAYIKARSADFDRCVSLELLHHHLQQLTWRSESRVQQQRFF